MLMLNNLGNLFWLGKSVIARSATTKQSLSEGIILSKAKQSQTEIAAAKRPRNDCVGSLHGAGNGDKTDPIMREHLEKSI
jgi:hypothetical protein